jgi:hypothetical protein
MTRADYALLVIVMCVLPFLYARLWTGNEHADYVQIQEGNDELLTSELSHDRTLSAQGPLGDSVIEINQGRARFVSSPCRGQVCVHSGWLQAAGEIAACLPNRISLTLHGQHPRFDAINF